MQQSGKRAIALALLGLMVAATGAAQRQEVRSATVEVPSPLSLEIAPAFDLPLGDSARWFSSGGTMDSGLSYALPGSALSVKGGLEYSYASVQAATSVSLAACRIGGGLRLPLGSGLSLGAYAFGGYYFATYNDRATSVTDPYLAAGLGLRFSLGPSMGLQLGAGYKNYFGLYEGLGAGIGLDVALGNLGGKVDLPAAELRPAFPVFYKYYDDHPIGTLQIKSDLKVPATDLKVQVLIKEYMDAPKLVEVADRLEPGRSQTVDLYALFNDKLLAITEGTKVAAEITLSYRVNGQSYENHLVESLTLWGRNAMTWDDNRKAAAYVTAKDPAVLNFARGISSYIRGREDRSICENLQTAIAFHEALDLYGLNYSPNPKTPYDRVSQQKDAIDFLQFPQETFRYRAGDCSDLSILYAALFEAVGIDAAFITIPGHIFIAVDSGLAPAEAPRELIPEGQFIARNNRAWVPIEVTAIHSGFVAAWQLGAKEWAENSAAGQAGFYPVSEAWQVYQPVGLAVGEASVPVPQPEAVLQAYRGETQKYLDLCLAPAVARLQAQIASSGSLAAMNSLGILYAKYGQSGKAEQEFKQILATRPYLPAMLNLGHLYFARKDWEKALAQYRQASELDPGNAHTILALARTSQELQNYDEAKLAYERLKTVNPTLAAQFAYLGGGKEGGARAADVESERRTVLWEGDL